MSNNPWQQFLTQQGAHWDARGVSHFGENLYPLVDAEKLSLIDLSNWSLLLISGKDARSFLQGQVTCDMAQVNTQQWKRGANCNIKGRAVFSFYCAQLPENNIDDDTEETFVLILPASVAAPAQDALKKYAMFSKVSIDIADTYQLFGLLGYAETLFTAENINFDNNILYPGDNFSILKLSDDRFFVFVKKDVAEDYWRQWSTQCNLQGYPAWQLASVNAGFADIEKETRDEFIPQLLNFHLTDGISFTKGCYLGQEIVARMEYRGSLKRHLRRATITTNSPTTLNLPALNTPIYSENSQSSVGNVVAAVQTDADSIELLVVITDSSFEANAAFLDQQKKHKLDFLSLPYAITK